MRALPGSRWIVAVASLASLLIGLTTALFGTCGPFTDVALDVFCPFVLEVFYTGITTGTTPSTYDPGSPVSRLQMAAFLSRTVVRPGDPVRQRPQFAGRGDLRW